MLAKHGVFVSINHTGVVSWLLSLIGLHALHSKE